MSAIDLREITQKLSGHTPKLQGADREYAVLVPLVEQCGALHLLFEVRADSLSRQPGEVCFPGGKIEPGESPTACAVRETGEELGIPASSIQVLAHLDFICHQSGFLMHPILAQVDAWAVTHLKPGPAEVKETFLVPLSCFLEHPPLCYSYQLMPDVPEDFPYERIGFPQGYAWKGGRVDVPIYTWENRAIWGLTGRIIRWLIDCIA